MNNNIEKLVVMRDVYSNEFYKSGTDSLEQVLKNISFNASNGEIWSIMGNSVFEIRLLVEIMAGARTYQKGQCSLSGFGMMHSKRTVLPHTFYIGSTNMMLGNMKVLEYLMFATSKSKIDALTRQQQILDKMIKVGLDNIVLAPIEILTPQEKSVVILFCATFSQSQLLIMNLPRLIYDTELIEAMAKITKLLRDDNKALVITTECFELAQSISTDIMLIQNGNVKYCGQLIDLLEKYDNIIYSIQSENSETIIQLLRSALPQYVYVLNNKNNIIDVFDYAKTSSSSDIYDVFSKIGIIPQAIFQNKLNLKNAYEEVLKKNDL